MKKEELVKENSRLGQVVENYEQKLRELRGQFTKVLAIRQPLYLGCTTHEDTLSWEQIFFKIGELNSDANYTILLEQKRLLEHEIDYLKQKKNKKRLGVEDE